VLLKRIDVKISVPILPAYFYCMFLTRKTYDHKNMFIDICKKHFRNLTSMAETAVVVVR